MKHIKSAEAQLEEFLAKYTPEIAGLAKAAPGQLFTESQLEARATSIRLAYKTARQIIMDIAK